MVDYKTGGAPREAFEARALFQLKFYALVLWRTRGVVPRVLRLLYLRDGEICDYTPDAEELAPVRTHRCWRCGGRSSAATAAGDFRPKPSRLCGWCSFQAHCPAFGGTPPPLPRVGQAAVPGPASPPPQETPPRPGDDQRPGRAGYRQAGGNRWRQVQEWLRRRPLVGDGLLAAALAGAADRGRCRWPPACRGCCRSPP